MCTRVGEATVVVTLCRKDRLHHILPVTTYYAEVVVVIAISTCTRTYTCMSTTLLSVLLMSRVERQICTYMVHRRDRSM